MIHPRQRDIDALLQGALAKLRAGRPIDGEVLLRQALALDPDQPDALQLLGLAAKNGGRAADAIGLFRRSLAARPEQPHVSNNLGTTLAAIGEAAEAEAQYRQALSLKPDYADASLNLGLLLQDMRRPREAVEILRAGLRHAPRNPALLNVLGTSLLELDDAPGAVAAARQAVQADPRHVMSQHNLGRALLAAGDPIGAELAYRAALALQPGLAPSIAGLSHVLRTLQRDEEAVALLGQAVARDPSDLDAHRNLGALLWELGRPDEALDAYRASLERQPRNTLLHAALAGELTRRDRLVDARHHIDRALMIDPNSPQALDAKARVAAREGDLDQAVQLGRQALGQLPGMPLLSVNLSDSLLRLHRFGEVVDLLMPVHKQVPDDQAVLSRLTAALRQTGDPAYAHFVDYDRMTTAIDVEPPRGFDRDSFDAALSDHLRSIHTAKAQPRDQTLEKGTQTFGNLFVVDRSPLIQALRTQIAKAVQGFIAGLPEDSAHPFFARRRSDLGFAGSWSVRLHRQGFHTNHMHPQGWISSAYYVSLPDETADADTKPGWFKFGESNLGLGGADAPERFIQPKPGRLVLFPSYFWHGTVPFEHGAERLTVAFDAVPV